MKDKDKVGFYMVLEGVDFCGKSTLAKKIVEILSGIYGADNVIHKREPSNENYGAKMRATLMSDEMTEEKEILAAKYMLLDRIENTTLVSGLLRENKIVIQERNFLTALVYNEAADTEDVKFIQEANKLSLKPDYLALITISDCSLSYRLEKAKEERGVLDRYETIEKVTKRNKDYFKYAEYISGVFSNDGKESFESNVKRLINIIRENYTSSSFVANIEKPEVCE